MPWEENGKGEYPYVIEIDRKSNRKERKYVTPIYDMIHNSLDYNVYIRKEKSLDKG